MVHLRADLRIVPQHLEEEFWMFSHQMRSYLDSADRWAWVTILVMNAYHKRLEHLFSPRCGMWTISCFLPIFYIGCGLSQRLFLQLRPDVYWTYRRSMTYANIIFRHVLTRLLAPNGQAVGVQFIKQMESRPPWAVVLSGLMGAGPLFQVIWRLNFPVSLKETLLSSMVWLAWGSRVYIREMQFALSQPATKQGLQSVCAAVHSTLGELLFLPSAVNEAEIERCTADPFWLLCFVQLLGVTCVLVHAYSIESYMKWSFLRDRGLAHEPSVAGQLACLVVTCVLSSYMGAYVMELYFAMFLASNRSVSE